MTTRTAGAPASDHAKPATMARQLHGIALMVAVLVACLLPTMGVVGSYLSQCKIQTTEAEINARLVSNLIHANPELWRLESLRLESVLGMRPLDKTPEIRSLHELNGDVIAESHNPLPTPWLTEEIPVHDAGVVVATLRVQRSLRPLIFQALWLSLLGLALGTAAYAATRLLPLRALRHAHDALIRAATYDPLTGLPNRELFMDRLRQAMQRAHATQRPLALVYLDLDRFKNVNDSLGHAAGDKVLLAVAATVQSCADRAPMTGRRAADRPGNIARLAGDEFALIVEGTGACESAQTLAADLLHALRKPITVEGRTVYVSGSVGIAPYPQGLAQDAEGLLVQADMAMYRAKSVGRNNLQMFDSALQESTRARIELDQALRGALARGEFTLHFQPKADLRGNTIEGVEALIRWNRPGHGLVPPDRFIPMLEENRLIHEVGAWVIRTACQQLAAWDRLGLAPFSIAVNLSAHQFRDPNLPLIVTQALSDAGIAAARLELELTESLLMDDSEASREVLAALSAIGVRAAIDDFGTGHSSLAYLKRFRIDTLKIDRAFVRGLPHDGDNRAICSAIIALAHNLQLSVVCEGVEDGEQLEFLRGIHCDSIQGYHLARPMPADDLTRWMAARVTVEAQALTAA